MKIFKTALPMSRTVAVADRRVGKLKLALLLLLLAAAPPAAAEDRARTWLGVGYGGGTAGNGDDGFALMGQLVHQRGGSHIAVRGVILVDPLGEDSDSFGELGLLYGRVSKGRAGHAAIAAGLAHTAVACGSGIDNCTTVGVPVVAEAAFRPTPVLGIGIQAFANLNKQRVFGGVVVFLQLGWMP